MGCIVHVMDFLHNISAELGEGYRMRQRRIETLQRACMALDMLFDQLVLTGFVMDVDKKTLELTIDLTFDMVVFFDDRMDAWWELLSHSDGFVSERADDGEHLKLKYRGIWEKVE